MTQYRNTGPTPLLLNVPLGREVAAAGDEDGGDYFETSADVVHPLVERQDGSSWVNTAQAVDAAAQKDAAQPEKPRRASAAKKTAKTAKRTGGEPS